MSWHATSVSLHIDEASWCHYGGLIFKTHHRNWENFASWGMLVNYVWIRRIKYYIYKYVRKQLTNIRIVYL